MLNISDNPSGISYGYIRKDFGSVPRANIELEFDFIPNVLNDGDVYLSLLRGEEGLPLTAIIMGGDGNIKLKNWNYETYPSLLSYPGINRYPKGTRRTYPPSYPGPRYPGISQPEDKIVTSAITRTYVRLSVVNLNSLSPEVRLFAQRYGLRGRSVYSGVLNWRNSIIKTVDLGCVYAVATPYNFSFDNILLSGDVPSEEWYLIKDYDGFKSGGGSLWQGAVDIFDASTYTEPTRLENLARYDYARVSNMIDPNLTWDSELTIEDLGEFTFNQEENEIPKGIKWQLP